MVLQCWKGTCFPSYIANQLEMHMTSDSSPQWITVHQAQVLNATVKNTAHYIIAQDPPEMPSLFRDMENVRVQSLGPSVRHRFQHAPLRSVYVNVNDLVDQEEVQKKLEFARRFSASISCVGKDADYLPIFFSTKPGNYGDVPPLFPLPDVHYQYDGAPMPDQNACDTVVRRLKCPSPFWLPLRAMSAFGVVQTDVNHQSVKVARKNGGEEEYEDWFNADTLTTPKVINYFNCRRLVPQRVFPTLPPFNDEQLLEMRHFSYHMNMWCSVWGTAEEFDAVGFPLREGPIGIRLLDVDGNEQFLVHALACKSVIDCLERIHQRTVVDSSKYSYMVLSSAMQLLSKAA